MKKNSITAMISCALLFITGVASSQQHFNKEVSDTSYIRSYEDLITSRLYCSQKYTNLLLPGKNSSAPLQYFPNTTLNMGVGITYGWLSLNLAFGFPFLNQGEKPKGKTKYLDLQSHIYSHKYSIDILGEFYKGYYLHPQGKAVTPPSEYYVRPDMKVMHLGIAAYRVINWKRFSFRAAMLQNEWQQKSAGSPLLGLELYYGKLRVDSAFVPYVLQEDYGQKAITAVQYFTLGPGVGYAYTLVIARHIFLTGSATGNLAVNLHKEWQPGKSATKVSIMPNLSYRAAAGYNSERWSVSILWVNNGLQTKGESGNYNVNTGNARANIAYRFMPGPKLKKSLRILAAN